MSEQGPEPVTDDELGPIGCLAVEFPAGGITGAGFDVLVDLVDRDVIRVLDLEFVAKRPDGTVESVAVTDIRATDGFDLAILDGASSGIVDQAGVADFGQAIGLGSVADGHVSPEDLLLALDTTEPD